MRGMLRIASARVPFQRAGLAWPTATPIEVHITTLDGERLLRLIREPVLTIQLSDGDGKFLPAPALDLDVTAEDLQRTIDQFANDAPPVILPPIEIDAAELERLRQVDAAWHADQRHLHDQGFQTLDALTSAWAVDRAAINGKIAELEMAQREIVSLLEANTTLAQERDDKTAELETARVDAAKLLTTIADLQAELAKAKKPGAKPKAAD